MLQPIQFGKYLLLERIAVGGMAEVFVAKAFGVEGFERLLAIKRILPTMGEDNEFNTMFVDEARIAVQLAHANIVQVLDLGKHDDNLFIAMEYISGRDVRQLLERYRKRGKPMPIAQACTIVGKVCEALDYAHRKRDARGSPLNIVHRDVSPQNVLVSFEGDVKLIDFGIAKAESRLQRTQSGILKGKFSYMSPEQVRGQPIDHRSDVFAAGVLLWELLCGEKLFTGESDFAVLEKVRTGKIPLPRKINPEVPELLERVVMKALAVEVVDRYQWASELHDALVRFTLFGDTVFGARQLAEWMREEFHAEFDREQARLRAWLGVTDEQVEVTPSDPLRRRVLSRPPPQSDLQHAKGALPPPVPLPVPPEQTPLVQQPTPTGARHRVAPSKTATPPPGELRAVSSTPLAGAPAGLRGPARPPPAPADDASSHELPTMKMDGNALAAAERLFAAKRAAEAASKRPSLSDSDEESTVNEPLQPKHLVKPVAPVSLSMGPDEKTPLVSPLLAITADLPMAQERPPAQGRSSSPGIKPVLAPTMPPAPPVDSNPPTAPLASDPPVARQHEAFDVSEERTVAPRAQRKGAFSKPLREEPCAATNPPSHLVRNIVLVVAAVAIVGIAGLALLPTDVAAPGKLVVTLSPSVPAELFIDGKPSGPVPPFVRALAQGTHRIELRAGGFKPFLATVDVKSASRPVELPIALVAEGPMQVEGVVLSQPGAEVVPREATRPRWLTGHEKDASKEPKVEPKVEAKAEPPPAAGPAAPAQGAAAAGAVPAKPLEPPRGSELAPPTEAPHDAEAARPLEPARPAEKSVHADKGAKAVHAEDETRAATAPAAESDSGKLRITTTPPGADVVIDARAVGQSPLVLGDLDATTIHIVVFTLQGYRSTKRVAKAEDGRFAPLSVTLESASDDALHPAPGSSSPGNPAVSPAGPSGGLDPPASDAAEANMGFLVTITKPTAKVIVDGKDTGRWTPVVPKNPIALAPGPHTITFETREGRRIDEQITVEAGKTARVIKTNL